ncbi:MAG: 4'-phosphopantetheinyl transferase superfamily protein [Bacillota bacterium]|nr:4'-phosphopantetheinyl transferase superfamily protein [Bacillota bacterium]
MNMKEAVTVYIADISSLLEPEEYSRVKSLVPEARRAKADAVKFAVGRARSLGAGLVLHEACRRSGLEGADEHMCYGEHGKPDFDQHRLRSTGLGEMHFSLSHSGHRVMCGISQVQIGCDVEIVKKRDMKIAGRFFAEAEYADIMAQNDDRIRLERFFRYWTIKESFIKCDGRGLSMPLSSFRIVMDEDGSIELDTGEKKGEYSFFSPDIEDGYSYACCVKQTDAEVRHEFINISRIRNSSP